MVEVKGISKPEKLWAQNDFESRVLNSKEHEVLIFPGYISIIDADYMEQVTGKYACTNVVWRNQFQFAIGVGLVGTDGGKGPITRIFKQVASAFDKMTKAEEKNVRRTAADEETELRKIVQALEAIRMSEKKRFIEKGFD